MPQLVARKRIEVVSFAMAVLAAALISLPVSFAGGSPGDRADWRAVQLNERVTAALNRPFVEARGQLKRVARLPSVRDHAAARCDRAMAVRDQSPRYTALGAVTRAGDLYCLSEPFTSPVNIADRPYFLRAVGRRGFGVGDFQIGRATGVDSLGLGYPSYNERGKLNGIVLSPFALDWLERRVGALRPARALDVLVVDDHGTVLARAGIHDTPPGRNLAAKPLVEAMLASASGTGRFRLEGQGVATAFDTVPATHGSVHVAVSVQRR